MEAKRFLMKLVVDRDETADAFDWKPALDRRAALRVFGAGAVGAVVTGCGSGGTVSTATTTTTTTTATSVSLGVSAASVMVGVSVTLTAMIAPSAATGTITFLNGTTVLGTATLSSGSAALTVSFTTAQTASLTVSYGGASSYAASVSSAVALSVVAVGTTATSTSLSVSSTVVPVGASITLTAQVTPNAATGTVTFYNGTTSLGTGTLASGIATLAVSFSTAQTAQLTAVYGGSTTYAGSMSSVVMVAISAASSATCGTGINPVTEGPYWVADSASGYNRSDLRQDVAGTNVQSGTQLTLVLYIYDRKKSCAAMQDVQVDIWHCNASGVYSGVKNSTNGNGADLTAQSWLRGYQLTDGAGRVAFTTIVPGWYQGRTTHIHLRFRSTYDSSSDGSTNTAQLFFDQTFIDTFDTTVYSLGKNSVTNAGDSIYNSEGGTTLLSLSGSASAGYTASFSVYLPLA